MNQTPNWDEDLPYDAEEEYEALLRALRRGHGFGILFVECSPQKGSELMARLKTDLSQKQFQVLSLDRASNTLYDRVADLWQQNPFDVLFVQGMENALLEYEYTKQLAGWTSQETHSYSWKGVPRILSHLNQQRERFRDNFNCCFVFLVPPFVIKYFIQRAPDFFDWRSGLFRFPDEPERISQRYRRITQFIKDEEHYDTLAFDQRNQELLEIQELLQEEYKITDQKVVLLLKQGLLLLTAKSYEAALNSYKQALELNPSMMISWECQGITLFRLGRYEEALASFDHALLLDPGNISIRKWQSRTLVNLERYEDAFVNYKHILKENPDDSEAIELINLTLILRDATLESRGLNLRLSKLEMTEKILNSIEGLISRIDNLNLDSGSEEFWQQIGVEILELESNEEYIELFENSLINQNIIRALIEVKGITLKNLKQYEEAIVTYQKALTLVPYSHEVVYNQACCYALMGDVIEAADCLSRAIALDPKYRELAKTDSDFDRIRGDGRFQMVLEEP